MIFFSIIETSLLKKFVIPLFIISFIFLALVPIIGVEVKGAKKMVRPFTFFRLQPIEILKPFFILTTVNILTLKNFKNSKLNIFSVFFY